jgi:hypothetical protein
MLSRRHLLQFLGVSSAAAWVSGTTNRVQAQPPSADSAAMAGMNMTPSPSADQPCTNLCDQSFERTNQYALARH